MAKNQPLFRGDDRKQVTLPDPKSKRSIVSHILFEGGLGRDTPWTSTTDNEGHAAHFAGKSGRVWKTDVPRIQARKGTYVPKKELLLLLRGFGKGKAKSTSASDVAFARAYVLQWEEHLIGWHDHDDVGEAVKATFW